MLVIRATGLTALESRASELLEDQVIFFMCTIPAVLSQCFRSHLPPDFIRPKWLWSLCHHLICSAALSCMNKGDTGVSLWKSWRKCNAWFIVFLSSSPRRGHFQSGCRHILNVIALVSAFWFDLSHHRYLSSSSLFKVYTAWRDSHCVTHHMHADCCLHRIVLYVLQQWVYQSNCWCHLFCLINSWPFQGTLSTALAEGHRVQQWRCKRRQSGESSVALETTSTDFS